MHCGPTNQNFGWAMAHPADAAAPPMDYKRCVFDDVPFSTLCSDDARCDIMQLNRFNVQPY